MVIKIKYHCGCLDFCIEMASSQTGQNLSLGFYITLSPLRSMLRDTHGASLHAGQARLGQCKGWKNTLHQKTQTHPGV